MKQLSMKNSLSNKQWSISQPLILDKNNLVNLQKGFLPSIHIQLSSMKNAIKAMGHNAYLKQKFPRITDTKIKKGIFMGSQIIEIMRQCF
jgi:hypothetical protein